MEKNLTPEESLSMIHEMIAQAKQSFMRISPFFILWGITFMVAGIMEFILKQQGHPLFWTSWPIAGFIGGGLAFWQGKKLSEQQQTETFMDRVSTFLWSGYVAALVLVLYMTVSSGTDPNPYVMLITGIPTFVTGALIRFPALKWGGVLFWVFALLAFNLNTQYSGLIFSVALLFGYLMPGIMLRNKEKDGIRPA